MYAVLREDYPTEADRIARSKPSSLGIVCETLPTLSDAREVATIGNRDYGNDSGHHYFTVHPAAELRRSLREEGYVV